METHKQKFLRKHRLPPDTSLSLDDISSLTDIPVSILQQVYNRGSGAWRTNIASVRIAKTFQKNPDVKSYPRSARLGREQWAMARVYSFVDKGKTFFTADRDLAVKAELL
jgi:hypothetical protein